MKFVKFKFSDNVLPIWAEYDENTPIYDATVCGFGFGKNSGNNLTGKEVVQADSLYDLDWKNTDLWCDKFTTGWVAPDGTYYGCNYHQHDKQAQFIHKKTERELEQLGYIKITKTRYINNFKHLVLIYDKSPTMAQYKWFDKNYVQSNREEVLENIQFWMKHTRQRRWSANTERTL